LGTVADISREERKVVAGEVCAVDCGTQRCGATALLVAPIAMFARKGGAETGRRPVWGVVAPLSIWICLVREPLVAMTLSCGIGAASVRLGWTSEVGGLRYLVLQPYV
jgi:hypothetical protein